MAYDVTVYPVLIAGPSDVRAERETAVRVLDEWNRDNEDHVGIRLRPMTWETDSRPALGGDPQSILDDQLVDRCEAIVAIFGNRLGTATPRAISGTAEEIQRAHAADKDVMVYFSKGDLPRGYDREQFDALEEFRAQISHQGLTGNYKTVEDLYETLRRHVADLGHLFQRRRLATTVESRGSGIGSQFNETDSRVLAAVGRFAIEHGTIHVAAQKVREDPTLADLPEKNLQDSLAVLIRYGLIAYLGRPVVPIDMVRLTPDGMERVLTTFMPRYEDQVRAIISAIIRDGLLRDEDISNSLGIPPIVVGHVMERLGDQGLLRISKTTDGIRARGWEPELERYLATSIGSPPPSVTTAPAQPREAEAKTNRDQRLEKACLALVNRGWIRKSGERITVQLVLQNEGDAPARDVQLEIENEAGQPYAGGGAIGTIAPEKERPIEVAFTTKTQGNGEAEERRFRIRVRFRDRHGWDNASFVAVIRGGGAQWMREIDRASTEFSEACRHVQP